MAVFFFRDPLTAQPHEPDVSALVRLCDVHDIPLATNPASAEALLLWHFGLNTLGAQVTYDTGKYALRLSGGGGSVLGLVYGIGADAAALFPVVGDLNTPSRLSLGAGLDVDVFFASLIIGDCAPPTACGNPAAAAVAYRPHVLRRLQAASAGQRYLLYGGRVTRRRHRARAGAHRLSGAASGP